MLQHIARPTAWMNAVTGVRFNSSKTKHSLQVNYEGRVHTGKSKMSKTSSVTWSSGEVTNPAPLDCPIGNKGEYPQDRPDGGRQYFGFVYHPRIPGEVDPPYEPAPLHLVTRVRTLHKRPWWDKDIMKKLGLHEKRSKVAIVKNNPENNAMLWKVKYLLKVTPLRVPADLPDDVDPRCCFLKETGDFSYSKRVLVEDSDLQEPPEITAKKWNGDFIDKHTRKHWQYPWQLKLC